MFEIVLIVAVSVALIVYAIGREIRQRRKMREHAMKAMDRS